MVDFFAESSAYRENGVATLGPGNRGRYGGGRNAARDFLDEELLEEASDRSTRGTDEGVADGEASTVSVRGGIVDVRDPSGSEVAEDVGVVGLPFPVVAFADDDGGDGIQGARGDGTCAFVEVARVLMEDGGEDCATDKGTDDSVAVRGAKAFCITLCALPISIEGVIRLLNSGDDCGDANGD